MSHKIVIPMAKPNDFGVGLMHEGAITAAKAGWEPEDFSKLAKDENLMKLIYGVLHGTHEIREIGNTNRDYKPNNRMHRVIIHNVSVCKREVKDVMKNDKVSFLEIISWEVEATINYEAFVVNSPKGFLPQRDTILKVYYIEG